jgi:predicted lactoylglutathione lyase
MATQIFINLPVKDLERSIEFFTDLGFTFNMEFTNKNAACMIISEEIFAMLLVQEFFATFTTKAICDTETHAEVINAIAFDDREAIDEMIHRAIAAGGTEPRPPQDHGWMYVRSFQDLDGHLWEVCWIDPSKRK